MFVSDSGSGKVCSIRGALDDPSSLGGEAHPVLLLL